MAQIDLTSTSAAICDALDKKPNVGPRLHEALKNMPEVESGLAAPRGLVMCDLEGEALPALTRSFGALQVPIDRFQFGAAVAGALQDYAQTFPPGGHNLCYPHFLLHGLLQPTIEEVTQKIEHNARIIEETAVAARRLICSFPKARNVLPGYDLIMQNGGTQDEAQGISLMLMPHESSNHRVDYMAKVGFYLDQTFRSAYVVNVQGRKVLKGNKVDQGEKNKGELYGRLSAKAGMDLRAFLLVKLREFLKERGFREIKAIRPQEHLMAIGGHPGFTAKYEKVLKEAGFKPLDDLYFSSR